MKVSYIVCDNEHCGKKLNDGDYVSMYLDNEHYDLCRECADKIKNMLKLATKRTSQKIKDGTVDKKGKVIEELDVQQQQTEIKIEEAEVVNKPDSTECTLENKTEIKVEESITVDKETDTQEVGDKQSKCLEVTDNSKDEQQDVNKHSKHNSDKTQKLKKEIVFEIIRAGGNYHDISNELGVCIGTAKTYYYTYRRKALGLEKKSKTDDKEADTEEVKEKAPNQKVITPEQMKGLDELMEDTFDIEYGMLSREQLKALAEVECTGTVGEDCRNCFYRDRKLNTCYYTVVTNKVNKVTRGSSCKHYINRKYKEEN